MLFLIFVKTVLTYPSWWPQKIRMGCMHKLPGRTVVCTRQAAMSLPPPPFLGS